MALVVASQVMKQYRGTPFDRDMCRAPDRTTELLLDRAEFSRDDLSHSLSVLPRVQTAYDPLVFRALWSAVRLRWKEMMELCRVFGGTFPIRDSARGTRELHPRPCLRNSLP